MAIFIFLLGQRHAVLQIAKKAPNAENMRAAGSRASDADMCAVGLLSKEMPKLFLVEQQLEDTIS